MKWSNMAEKNLLKISLILHIKIVTKPVKNLVHKF